jgi:putative endonuclease
MPGRRYFFVYILTNISRSVLYTGVTRDLRTRVFEHRMGMKSGFAHRYRTTRLVWYEVHESPTSAILREKQIKGGSRRRKIVLIETMNPKWNDLARQL